MTNPERPSAGKMALVISDSKRGPTATQKISFGQPFDQANGSPPVRIAFERHHSHSPDIIKAFEANRPDILVLSRYTSKQGLDWIRLARNAGIPVIFHIDDDLLAVPANLGEAKYVAYNNPERLKALRENIESSDLLYVSTSELARRFHDHDIRTPIISGDIYCSVSTDHVGALIPPASAPVIGYMGTSGHSADLAMMVPAICEVMEAVPGLQFEVFGTIAMPPELARFGRRTRHLPPVADYAAFIPYLRSLGWWVGLAPLEDHVFNRCKADTKWVEYSLAGMAVVASDLTVYRPACANGAGMLAGTKAAWRDAILALVYQPNLREKVVDTAQKKLRKSYTHDRLRAQVIDVFDKAFAALAGSAGGLNRTPTPSKPVSRAD